MINRKSIILFVLVVAFLSCSQSAKIAGAEEQAIGIWRTGITTSECIFIQAENPPIYIKVLRSKDDLCAEYVEQYDNEKCEGKGLLIEGLKGPGKTDAYSVGNQVCRESIVVYKNSDPCYEYYSGGRVRYIPRG